MHKKYQWFADNDGVHRLRPTDVAKGPGLANIRQSYPTMDKPSGWFLWSSRGKGGKEDTLEGAKEKAEKAAFIL